MLCERLNCKVLGLQSLSLNGMVGGGGINVKCLVANLGDGGSGHHEVHFFALSNPAKPLAVPTLVQELRRVQAGDRSASYTLFPGPCRGNNISGTSQIANATPGIKIIGVLDPILRQRQRHRRLRRRHSTVGGRANIRRRQPRFVMRSRIRS